MDSLSSILGAQKGPQLPPEITAIKVYVEQHFSGCAVRVSIKQKQIIVHADSAAFAGALRMHIHHLQTLCASDQKIVIRIG